MSAVSCQAVRLALTSLFVCLAASTSAEVVWNEPDWGDTSNDRLAPTSIPLAQGTNSFIATLQGIDLDYITVVVPEDHQLSALVLASYKSDDGIAFIGVQAGTQMTVPTTAETAEGLLGWSHFGDGFGNVGTDILPGMGTSGFFSEGFIPPLPSGPYTFWIQQVDGVHVDYQFDFQVTSTTVGLLVGDYNNDGAVDAADYTVWRDRRNQNVALTNEDPAAVTPGFVDAEDFVFWKNHFGETAGGGSAVNASMAVPEPSKLILVALAGFGVFAIHRRWTDPSRLLWIAPGRRKLQG